MVKIIFKKGDNSETIDVPVGTSILEAAHQFITEPDIVLEGACEGSLACSTCHVILEEEVYAKLSQSAEATEDEEDMLDMAFGLTGTSRLGCQIYVSEELEGAVFTIPSKN